jgi:uncharacterized protein YbjT (DUF2867 family)
MERTILVAGASGDVGAEVVRALRERGARVRAMVRATPLRDADGVEVVEGDLADRASIDRAMRGVTAAVFMTPHHTREEELGASFVEAAQAARLQRLVFCAAAHPTSRFRVIQRLYDALVGLIGPHYRPKLAVERRVRASGLSPVILCPSNFYQNDETGIGEILDGVYPHPLGSKRASRVDTRDIGDAAARALLDDVAPGTYPLLGPDLLTGPECAAIWARALGRDVRYAGDDLAAWRATIAPRVTPAKAADFERTYKVIQRFGIPATRRARAATARLLGRPARSYESYVAERYGRITPLSITMTPAARMSSTARSASPGASSTARQPSSTR